MNQRLKKTIIASVISGITYYYVTLWLFKENKNLPEAQEQKKR